MATGDGWTSQLLTGLAEHLAANLSPALPVVWRPPPGAVYTEAEVGILLRAVPPTPDRIITLAPYVATGAGSALADVTIGVQVRMRGLEDPRVVEDLADEVHDLLDRSGRQTWGTVSIVDVWRQSYSSLGQDGNRRFEASHNYYVAAMRPTIHRSN